MKKGVWTALVTPFTENGGVAYDKLAALIEFQIRNGADGLVLLGTTGEAPTISDEETDEIVRIGLEAAGRVPVMVGCASNDTARAAARARHLSAFDVEALLVLTPYYNKANDDGVAAHFLTVAEASQKPIVLYHVPPRTGCRLSPRVVERLREHPNIVGVKEASGEIGTLTEFAALAREDFSLYCGCDELTVPALALGAIGVISVASNLLPRQMHEMTERFFAGDLAAARNVQFDLLPLIRALFSEVNPIPIKEAMNALGFAVGGYRLPLCPMREETRTRLLFELESKKADIPRLE